MVVIIIIGLTMGWVLAAGDTPIAETQAEGSLCSDLEQTDHWLKLHRAYEDAPNWPMMRKKVRELEAEVTAGVVYAERLDDQGRPHGVDWEAMEAANQMLREELRITGRDC